MPKITRKTWPAPSKWTNRSFCDRCGAKGICDITDLKDVGPTRTGQLPALHAIFTEDVKCGIPCPTADCKGRWNLRVPLSVWEVYCSHIELADNDLEQLRKKHEREREEMKKKEEEQAEERKRRKAIHDSDEDA
jgi:hypothetical protein